MALRKGLDQGNDQRRLRLFAYPEDDHVADQAARFGVDLISTSGLRSALDLLDQERFDAVLFELPFGEDLFTRLRSDERLQRLPRIAILADPSDTDSLLEPYRLGADFVGIKPLPDEFWLEILPRIVGSLS